MKAIRGCMGANQEEAFCRADAETEKVWQKMIKENHLYFFGEATEQRLKEELRKTIREIFWQSACDSF